MRSSYTYNKTMTKNQTKVRLQQKKKGQFTITVPEIVAKQWLGVSRGDRLEFIPYMGKICLQKVVEE